MRRLISRTLTAVMCFLVRAYQVAISPHLGPSCRFSPSCSQYAVEAIEEHGPWFGGKLAVRRLLRCHPFTAGGFDPVPGAGGPHGS